MVWCGVGAEEFFVCTHEKFLLCRPTHWGAACTHEEFLSCTYREFLGRTMHSVGHWKAAAVVSATVGGCRELVVLLLSIADIATSSAVAKTSVALTTSLSSGSARPLGYLRVTPTWRESADPVTPCPPTGGWPPSGSSWGGWSRARPPLSTPTPTLSWTQLAVPRKKSTQGWSWPPRLSRRVVCLQVPLHFWPLLW